MARGRMIDRVIILSKKINAVSEGAENLYYRIYVSTDDFGLFHADPKILKGQIYTLRSISVATIEKRLNELIEIGLFKVYENNGEKYLEATDFEKHQTFRKDYIRKYEYPKPNTKLYETVRSRTKSPTNINKIKLIKIKLKEEEEQKVNINAEQEMQIDKELKTVKNLDDKKRGMIIQYLRQLSIEFPELDYVEQMKKKVVWWLDNPLNKNSNIHLQIRNWFIKAREFLEEGDKERKVGKSYVKDQQFSEFSNSLSMEFINKVYKIIDKKGGDKGEFYNKARSAFPIIRTQWDNSDQKPETFIKLVEGV